MSEKNRRSHGRVNFRLGVVCAKGAESGIATGECWTHDVSVGGMYLVAPSGSAPSQDGVLAFELSVPPGEGYSATGCRLQASGQVLRQVPRDDGKVGLAVKFADTPTVETS